MSLPHLFSLSNELLIEIISNLGPIDIYACQCTCRGLNEVIVNSELIQYIKRTALNGVFDPLEPGPSLPERLDVLERWENAWMEMDLREPDAIIDVPVSAEGVPMTGSGFLSGQYFIIYHSPPGIGVSALYSFLDIHAMSSHTTNPARWTTIEIDTQWPILSFNFALEFNLVVAISAPTDFHPPQTTVTIRSLQFNTGDPHPLASQPNLEVSVFSSVPYERISSIIIGDYILFCIGTSDGNIPGSLCAIFLVAWKEGWASKIWASRPGVYSSSLSVLSEEIILLVRHREPALELCRLSNINSREEASLKTVCILSLPQLTAGTSLWWTICFDERPGHMLYWKTHQQDPSLPPDLLLPTSPGLSTLQPESRINARRHLETVPVDDVIVLLMHFNNKLSSSSYVFDLTVRRRTLLGFCNAETSALGTGTSTGVGTVITMPWEKWGLNDAHFREHWQDLMWAGAVFGERCAIASVRKMHISIRDYNPFRVQRALKLTGRAETEVTLECGSVVKVVKEKVVYRGGTKCFCDDIETSLPYVKTVVPYSSCYRFLMDKDNLVVVRLKGGAIEPKFRFHFL